MRAAGGGAASRRIAGTTWPRLLLFGGLALAIVAADQVSKAWVDASFGISRGTAGSGFVAPTPVLGDWVRIAKGYNDGAIFSLFGASATFFAIASLAAIAAILWYAIFRGSRASLLLTLALGLLMGGAAGNLVDRLRLGHVIDFVDVGIGGMRWYTFNVADAAISCSIVLLLAITVLGDRAGGAPDPAAGRGADGGGSGPEETPRADGAAAPLRDASGRAE